MHFDARLLVAMPVVMLKKKVSWLFSIHLLHHTYRRVSGGGADGSVMGVNGSINPLAVFCMLMAMKVEPSSVGSTDEPTDERAIEPAAGRLAGRRAGERAAGGYGPPQAARAPAGVVGGE